MNNKTIIEFGFRIIWRIMDISEGVIRLGLRPRRITPSTICIILHKISASLMYSIPYHAAVEYLSQHLQLHSVQLTEKIFTPDEPLQRSWYLAGGLNQRTSGPSFSDVKSNDKQNCSPTSAIVSGFYLIAGSQTVNLTEPQPGSRGWGMGEGGGGCVEGLSRQSNPFNTDINGAVEPGCPY